MNEITITTTDNGRIAVSTPFHREFPPAARLLGGRWVAADKVWTFDPRDEAAARALVKRLFGTDGSPEEDGDLVTVRVRLAYYEGDKRDNAARFAGREIARRPGRDMDVRLAANVVLVAGTLPGRGGSVQYPTIDAGPDVIVEIRDLPRAALTTEDADRYEIVGETPEETDRAALLAEKAELLARLAEINAQLGDDDQDDDEPEAGTPATTSTPAPAAAPAAPQIATTAEYAAQVGRSARTIRRWIAAGRVAARRIGRAWVILPAPALATA